ncbi:hypothetical protein [Actinocorallia longicatena]|uniref:Alpha-1,2-mannosyltransferase n=1 Tax=Actinocorallia longicatena TaxID=111803 RepID=A0ABP6QKZ1_9ACTN
MSYVSPRAGSAALALIAVSAGLGACACLLGPSAAVPETGGWSLGARPGYPAVVWLTFLMAGTGLAGILTGLAAARAGWRPSGRSLLLGGLGLALLLAVVPVGGSTDVLSYALYGRIGRLGHDPYQFTVQRLIDAGDPVAAYAPQSWRNVPSVYGPIANWMFAGAAAVGGASMASITVLLKLMSFGAFAAVAVLLDRLAADRVRAHLLWTLNPLMLWVCVAGAHADVFGAALLVAAFAVFRLPWPAWATGLATGALVGAAGGTKAPFLLAGFGFAWAARRSLPLLCGLLGGALVTGLGSYLAAGWESVEAVLNRSEQTAPTNPWRYLPGWGIDLSGPQMARLGFAAAALIAVLMLWRLTLAATPVESAARVAFAVCAPVLMASPVQHAWYDVLIFPLLVLMPVPTRLDGLMQTRLAVGLCGYLPGVPLPGPDLWPDQVRFIRFTVNNWWVSAGLGIIAIIVVAVVVKGSSFEARSRTGRLTPDDPAGVGLSPVGGAGGP